MGTMATSCWLAPHANSLKAYLPYRLRHSFYKNILSQEYQKVKHFFVVLMHKFEARFLLKINNVSPFLQMLLTNGNFNGLMYAYK